MPDNNPLKENIPYYWYLHGPYSDVVDHDLKSLVFKNLIEKSDEGLYSLKKGVDVNEITQINVDDEVIDIMDRFLKPKIFYNLENIVYKEDAFYEFMYLYKIKFNKPFKNISIYLKGVV